MDVEGGVMTPEIRIVAWVLVWLFASVMLRPSYKEVPTLRYGTFAWLAGAKEQVPTSRGERIAAMLLAGLVGTVVVAVL
jgi:hypothetical protein